MAEASVAGSETVGVRSVFGVGGDFGWGVLSDAERRRIRKRLRVVDPFMKRVTKGFRRELLLFSPDCFFRIAFSQKELSVPVCRRHIEASKKKRGRRDREIRCSPCLGVPVSVELGTLCVGIHTRLLRALA